VKYARLPAVKKGDRVRVIAIPADLPEDERMQTRALFEQCVGRTFSIASIKEVEGLPYPLIQLDVGEVNGHAPYLETIWIEPQYLELA
jgi:hypothetical protein